jgi:hypothetical protein
MAYSGKDDDDTTTGPIDVFFNYKLDATNIRTWHVMVFALVLGFVLGKII